MSGDLVQQRLRSEQRARHEQELHNAKLHLLRLQAEAAMLEVEWQRRRLDRS